MSQKRVLFLYSGILLNSAFMKNLEKEGDIYIYGFTHTDLQTTFLEIEKIKPDVVVIADTFDPSDTSALVFHGGSKSRYRTVVVDSEENFVELFNSQKIEIKNNKDFIKVIQSTDFPNHLSGEKKNES